MLGLVSASAWQILPNSQFLRELAEGELPRSVEYVTIAAQRDWFCPPKATVLAGAKQIRVPLGHASLVVSDEVYRHVRRALRG